MPLVLPLQPAAHARRAPLARVQDAEPGFEAWAKDSVRPQKQAGFSSVVIRTVGDPLNGTYCCRYERQSALPTNNQLPANQRDVSRPIRPTRSESVYDCSLLRSPPRIAVTIHGVAIRDWAPARAPAAGAPVSADGSRDAFPTCPPVWNAASTTWPGRGCATSTPALTAAGDGSSITTACGSSGAPLREGPFSALSQASR